MGSYLPSLYTLGYEVEVERVSKDKESLIICVSCMCLYRLGLLMERLPLVSVLHAGLHEDAILLGREICSSHDLPQEEDLRFVVSLHSRSLRNIKLISAHCLVVHLVCGLLNDPVLLILFFFFLFSAAVAASSELS